MRDAVIVGAVRTPVGKRNGGFADVHPVDLGGHVLQALAARAGFDPADVDDVIFGCVSQSGEQSWNVGRNVVLAAGWPASVRGTTLDRQCGSSQQAVHFAAATVLSGQADLMTSMLHYQQEQGIRYGLQTMCEGGGMANATIIEAVL